MKTCTKCGEEKREDQFHWRIKDFARKSKCKVCISADDKIKRKNGKKKVYKNTRDEEKQIMSEESELFNPLITQAWKKGLKLTGPSSQ